MKQLILTVALLSLIGCAGTDNRSLVKGKASGLFSSQVSSQEVSLVSYRDLIGSREKGAYEKCTKGDYREGLKELYKKFKSNQKSPKYFNQIGLCYLRAESFDFAALYFHKAWGVSKFQFLPAYYHLGLISMSLKDFDKAERIFTEVVKKDPRFFYGHLGLYEISKYFGNYSQALNYFGSFERTLPGEIRGILRNKINFSRGVLLFKLGRLWLAYGYLSQITKEELKKFDKEDIYLKILVSLGKDQEAIEYSGETKLEELEQYRITQL